MGKHFRVFGDLVVTDEDGNEHHPAGRQAQILAVLLAFHPDSVTSGRLIDEVWGESPPKDPDSALHNAVSRLRHMVGADLVTTPTGYALTPTMLDFERFDQAVEAARRSSRLEDYESAIRLWTGDPFRGYEDHPTVTLEIERLKQSHRRASQNWHALLLEHGRADEAAEKLKLAVTAHPLDEGPLGLYMRALNASGRKPEALHAFRDYESRLAEETGLEPSVAIRELELSILVGELDLPERESRPTITMDISVSYVERGDGTNVAVGRTGTGSQLFIHPGWLSALDLVSAGLDMRTPFWAALSRTHELVIFDRFGTGLSKGSPDDTSFGASVEELKTLLRKTTDVPVPVWAASAAGPIGVQVAVEAPELISHLILYGTYASGPEIFSRAVAESISSLVRASWGVGSDVLAQMLFPGGSAEQRDAWARFQKKTASPELAAQLLDQIYAADVSRMLDRVTVPCLVIHYRGDKGIPATGGEQLARGIPNAQFVMLDGISHYPLPGDEDRVVEIVDRFLEGDRVVTAG
jgi:DNA-binding SARP family transcriptional activator/pimeloyl-ACP methyl ester carboxylesterase